MCLAVIRPGAPACAFSRLLCFAVTRLSTAPLCPVHRHVKPSCGQTYQLTVNMRVFLPSCGKSRSPSLVEWLCWLCPSCWVVVDRHEVETPNQAVRVCLPPLLAVMRFRGSFPQVLSTAAYASCARQLLTGEAGPSCGSPFLSSTSSLRYRHAGVVGVQQVPCSNPAGDLGYRLWSAVMRQPSGSVSLQVRHSGFCDWCVHRP